MIMEKHKAGAEVKDATGNFRFKPSVLVKLHALAEAEHRSMANFLELLIVDAHEKAVSQGKVKNVK